MSDRTPKHEEDARLIDGLLDDLAPVAPVNFSRTIIFALVAQAAVVGAAAWLIGARALNASRLIDPMFVGLLLALAVGAVASAATMTALAIPGRGAGGGRRAMILGLPLFLAASIIAISPWGGTWNGFSAVFIEGFGCTRHTLMVAVPAWLAGLSLLRRLAPLDPLRVGLFSGSSALFLSALVIQIACPDCGSWHLAIWHYAPLLLAAWLAAMLTPLLLPASTGRESRR